MEKPGTRPGFSIAPALLLPAIILAAADAIEFGPAAAMRAPRGAADRRTDHAARDRAHRASHQQSGACADRGARYRGVARACVRGARQRNHGEPGNSDYGLTHGSFSLRNS